jgi:serine/threonine-protein kinase RsbW
MALTERINKKIVIQSEIRYIKKVSKEIVGALQQLEIDKSIQFDIRLVVEETVRNAIEHAHHHKKELPVTIFYTADKDKIEIEIEDRGEGFDYKKVPDPTDNNNLMKEGGRGVYLVHKLMDKVTYNEKGNKVKITKFFKHS